MKRDEELERAESIAREAGQLVLTFVSGDRMQARAKGEKDVVTAADTASEALVLSRIREAFPGDGVVAEEGGSEPAASGRQWFVDPLDGTVNFAHRLPVWCVSLGLFDVDGPLLGVIHDPIRDETFTAARGEGVWLNGEPIRSSRVTRAEDAFVHLTIDFNPESLWSGLEDIQVLAPRVLRTRNLGSAALALAYVACGRFDGMVHRLANTWDYGAGVLMVKEAGGTVTRVDGQPYAVEATAIVAAGTAPLQQEIRDLINRSGPSAVE